MEQLRVNGFSFDYYSAGDPQDDLVIFLHGFPETAYMWRNLMRDISARGYYCIAPNQRGYSIGARPNGKRNYRLDYLSSDVMSFANELGKDKFHLVGHDWGAAIGWKVVADNEERIISWTALSVPHIQAFFKSILTDEEQQKKSRYIKSFQWPILPELRLKSNNFKILRKIWKYSEKEEVENYISVFKQRGAMTATLNYYRATRNLPKASLKSQICGNIKTPTLFIWGERDIAIGPKSVERGHEFLIGPYKFVKLNAGHFMVQTHYEKILSCVMESLKGLE